MDRRQAFDVIYGVDEQGFARPCSVTFCTLSLSRKTGGDIRTIEGVIPTGSRTDLQRSRMINMVPKADRGQRRGTETHIHICLLLAVNGEYINRQ